MINNTNPFLDRYEIDDVLMGATKVGHDHIVPLIQRKETLLTSHLRLHLEGQMEGDDLHDKVVQALISTEEELDRAWSAPWN